MRRSPIQRKTPLRRTPWDRAQARLKSDPKPLPPVSKKRRRRFVEYGRVREAVFTRDRWTCVFFAEGITGPGIPRCGGRLTPHHRRKASAGGAYTAANLATACSVHNGFIEDEPELVRRLCPWLVVREGDSEWESLGERNNR